MKIAIINDMPDEANMLKEYIDTWCRSNSIIHECDLYPDGSMFIDNNLYGKYDLVFLDIYMKELNGIETARLIRSSKKNCSIVFVTSSNEHMQEAFSVHAFDYINKPADYQRISRVLDDLNGSLSTNNFFVDIYADRHNYRVAFEDILYIEADSNYCLITADVLYRSRISFGEIQRMLFHDRRFLTINRGLIVNMDYVRDMDDGICTLKNDCSFSMNSRRSHHLKQTFIDYNFMKHNPYR